MPAGPEWTDVESPLIDQLVAMGWRHSTGNLDHPDALGRESFRDVLLTGELRQALRRINLDPSGEPWLDGDRITQAVHALSRLGTAKLLEANQKATALLLKGTVVEGVQGWDQGRGRTVHFIDWEHPENNRFLVVNQFKVACPAGQADKHIIPDLVLFVNGIPVVVIEAKSPTGTEALENAIIQLQRYANRRREHGIVDVDEGNEQLFHYAQFVVATCRDRARVGTFSSQSVHYQAWKDTSPVPMAEVAAELGKERGALNEQETLVAGMLRPAHLLDIMRHFTLFMEVSGRTIKAVCRYQQFRAVQLAVRRLLEGKTRAEDGEHDRRGGIIWHTQGSGKSLTMVFLIRKMRSHPRLRRFKVVVVTDRRSLEIQLSDTATLTGEVLTKVKARKVGLRTIPSYEVLQEVLAQKGTDLVFAMIQKYRGELVDSDDELDDEAPDDDELDGDDFDESKPKRKTKPPAKTKPLPELNCDEDILVLVDEAHRSHTSSAHANLKRALPNCAMIGFTGTPIIMRAKGKTEEIFGAEIDRYTIREAEADGAVVPILYEGRTTSAAVVGGGKLDEVFEDMLAPRSKEQLEEIKKKYATKGHVMEAQALIAAKARNMLRHYVAHILPNGYKAQVVAVSRRATIRYYDALRAARDELVAELEALHPNLLGAGSVQWDELALAELDPYKAFLLRAHRFLPTIRALEFAPVISSEHNDTVDPKREWSSKSKVDARIKQFTMPLFVDGPNTFDHEKASPLAFLIVKSMLLTGFDAPIEQVMYLDRHIKEAELLQAIARVNRTHAVGGVPKGHGRVVDYFGVAQHLKKALKAYAEADIEGALQSLADEIPKLRDRHHRARDFFISRGIEEPCERRNADACIELLRDDKARAEFHVKLKQFLATLDLVLPRAEALPYVYDAKFLAYLQARARNLYRGDEQLIGQEVGAKVRRLIDEHVESQGIDPKIPPVALTAANFAAEVDKHRSPRAKASEMEHALRYHIRKHLDEDPTHYQKLSERLSGILAEFKGRWEEMVKALEALVDEATRGRAQDATTGLDPETQAPFFDLLQAEIAGKSGLEGEPLQGVCALTVELVDHIRQEIGIVGFWAKPVAREALRGWIFRTLDDAGVLPFDRLDAVADKLMELAKANAHRLVRPS